MSTGFDGRTLQRPTPPRSHSFSIGLGKLLIESVVERAALHKVSRRIEAGFDRGG